MARVDLAAYHQTGPERERVSSLMSMLPSGLGRVLDIGARDGYITGLLAERAAHVTALDLRLPAIAHERVTCVQGNAAALDFADGSFDLVFCAEVLEHIPSPALEAACREMARVSRKHVLIGVPYRQDTRVGRTTCRTCGGVNPPWGHVNSFDQARLNALFPALSVAHVERIGTADAPTNPLSTWLLDRAGNPFGDYSQEEHCNHCDAPLLPPARRSLVQRLCTRAAVVLRDQQRRFHRPHANWTHTLYSRPAS